GRGGHTRRGRDRPIHQEPRMHAKKLRAALALARAIRLDRIVFDSPQARFGIVTTGKSYLDVRQALEDLRISEREARDIGLRLYKVAMSWPLEPEGARRFAEGLEGGLVVEGKRAVIETRLKEQPYNWPADRRPRIIGKHDESEQWMLPSPGELSPNQVAKVIGERLARLGLGAHVAERLAAIEAREKQQSSNVVPFA